MHMTYVAAGLLSLTSAAWSQPASDTRGAERKPPMKSESSTGRTGTPETKGQLQPQGWTGPINTGKGGAPAESPQGQSPPGMQAAPEGSSKTTVEPADK
jgi:hypothetical protein